MRRALSTQAEQTEAQIVQPRALPAPAEITDNPLLLECWEWTVGDSTRFGEHHLPQLIRYCTWWAVLRQCQANLSVEGGGITTKTFTIQGEKVDPDIRTLTLASNQMRQLEVELGLTPLAETRLNLNRAVTMTLASTVPQKIFGIFDERYGKK